MNRLLVVAVLAVGLPVEAGAAQLTIDYVAPAKRGVVGAPADHIAAMRTLIEKIDHETRFPRAVKVAYRECGTPNSYYHYTGTIEICHELWDERRRMFQAGGLDEKTLELTLRGAMMFTFFHELGHAFHRELRLPLVGRYEDAVDEIATITMIQRGLGDAAAQAAYGHYLRSLQPTYGYQPWDEHGSAAQRGFSIACLLYGADKDRRADLVKRMNIPAKQLEKCTREYPERVTTWAALMRRRT